MGTEVDVTFKAEVGLVTETTVGDITGNTLTIEGSEPSITVNTDDTPSSL